MGDQVVADGLGLLQVNNIAAGLVKLDQRADQAAVDIAIDGLINMGQANFTALLIVEGVVAVAGFGWAGRNTVGGAIYRTILAGVIGPLWRA